MKHGWKTRIDERRYFEEKLAARKARIAMNETWYEDEKKAAKEDYLACLEIRGQIAGMESINGKQWL